MASSNAFEFITYSTQRPGAPAFDQEQKRQVRSAVMRDYARRSDLPPEQVPEQARTPMPLAACRMKFRVKPARRKRTRQEEGSDAGTLCEQAPDSNIPSAGNLLNAYFIAIDTSSPETQSLLHYYLHDYYANSVAINPDGAWTIFTLADTAMIHAKLSVVAMDRADRTHSQHPPEHLYHRGKALEEVIGRLTATTSAHTDLDIATIALIASLDDQSPRESDSGDAHLKALNSLVLQKGGGHLDELPHWIQRAVGWADLLHATMNESTPMFELPSIARNTRLLEPDCDPPRSWKTENEQFQARNGLRPLLNILRRLELLIQLQSQMLDSKGNDMRTRQTFSNGLWNLEQDVHHMRRHSNSLRFFPGHTAEALTAFKDAALVCAYSNLRLNHSVAVFGRLAYRIRQRAFRLLNSLHHADSTIASTGEAEVLLWILLMGWKSAVLAWKDSGWFTERASEWILFQNLRDQIYGMRDQSCLITTGLSSWELEQVREQLRLSEGI
jgi:hypothetical protein